MVDELKKDVMQLMYVGHIEETVDVAGYKFLLCTLNTSEDIAVLNAVQHLTGAAQVAQMQVEILARAIKSVNGSPLESLNTSKEQNPSVVAKRVAVVSSWQIGLMSKIFGEYNKLVERSNQALGL